MSENQSSNKAGTVVLGFMVAFFIIIPLMFSEKGLLVLIGGTVLFCFAWARAEDKSGYHAFLKGIGIFVLTILLLWGSCMVLLGGL